VLGEPEDVAVGPDGVGVGVGADVGGVLVPIGRTGERQRGQRILVEPTWARQ
jgi:hypothetical protein